MIIKQIDFDEENTKNKETQKQPRYLQINKINDTLF